MTTRISRPRPRVGHHWTAVRLPVELPAGHGVCHHARVRRDELARAKLDRPAGAMVRLRLRLRADACSCPTIRRSNGDGWLRAFSLPPSRCSIPTARTPAACQIRLCSTRRRGGRGPSTRARLSALRLAIEGKLDSLAVAVGDGHRVVSPFPVAICSGKAANSCEARHHLSSAR